MGARLTLMPTGTVTIIAGPDEPERRAVQEVRDALGESATVVETGIDEHASRGAAMRQVFHFMGSASVFVISEATLMNESRRSVLVEGNPFLEMSDFRVYYIWTMENPLEVLRRYADLAPLVDSMPPPRPRREIIADLVAWVRAHPDPTGRQRVAALPAQLGKTLLGIVGFLFLMTRIIAQVGMLGAPLLGLLLLFGAGESWRWTLALLSLFNLGWVIGGIETFDRWPWTYGDVDPGTASAAVRRVRRHAMAVQCAMTAVLGLPAAASARIDHIPARWVIGAVLAGIVNELILTKFYRYSWPRHFERLGISSKSPISQRAAALRPPIKGQASLRVDFDPSEWPRLHRWMSDLRHGGRASARPWVRPADFVFISYAWADDRQRDNVTALANALTRASLPYFLDRDVIDSDFAAWRPQVAAALARASHVLLVVSPHLGEGKTVRREATMITQRWHIDTLPAVLCVGDPNLGLRLAADRGVPLELRFLLAWCTWLTRDQALDPVLLQQRIAEHRRQGRLRDWWTLIA